MKGDKYVMSKAAVELSPGGTKTVDVNMMGLVYGKKRKSSKSESKDGDEEEEYNVTLPDHAYPPYDFNEEKHRDEVEDIRRRYGNGHSPNSPQS